MFVNSDKYKYKNIYLPPWKKYNIYFPLEKYNWISLYTIILIDSLIHSVLFNEVSKLLHKIILITNPLIQTRSWEVVQREVCDKEKSTFSLSHIRNNNISIIEKKNRFSNLLVDH